MGCVAQFESIQILTYERIAASPQSMFSVSLKSYSRHTGDLQEGG